MSDTDPELMILLREIKADMVRLGNTWNLIHLDIQQHLKAANEAAEAQEKNKQSISPLLVKVEPDPSAVGECKTKDDEQSSRDRVRLAVEFFTLAVVFAYTLISNWQLTNLRISTEAAVDAARIASDSIRINQANFQRDQRPYVMAQKVWRLPMVADRPIMVNFYWSNFGKSPAINEAGRGEVFFGKNAMRDAYRWFDREGKMEVPKIGIVIPPGLVPDTEQNATTPPRAGPGGFSTFVSKRTPTEGETAFIKANDLSVVTVARDWYRDGWGNLYWTDTCVAYFISGADPKCPDHNEIH